MQRISVALGLALSALVGMLGGCDRPSDNAVVEQQLQERVERNRSLQQRIDELRAQVQGDVCAPAPGHPGHASASPPVAASPVPPVVPASSAPPTLLTRDQLVRRLEATTVLVLAPPMTGSGFFVTPDTVITNRHVVEKAENGEVILVGKALGEPLLARVAAITPTVPKDSNGRDYAILKLQQGVAGRQTLAIARSVAPLEEVVAAGFPGLLLSNDSSFQALIKGDLAAIPDLALSRGEVMAIQNRDQGFATIAHTAQISSGNSGGPLVDRCGRVVGINTFLTVNATESSKAAYALAGADLAGYAAAHGVGLAVTDTKCGE